MGQFEAVLSLIALSCCFPAGLCEEPVDVSSFVAQRQQHPWHPSWYNDKIDWLVVLVTVLGAVGLKWLQSEPSTEPQIEQKLEQTRSMFIESAEQSELLQAKVDGHFEALASREDRESQIEAKRIESLESKSEDFKVRFEFSEPCAAREPEIQLPAAGEKYPLGLARSPSSSSEALSWFQQTSSSMF